MEREREKEEEGHKQKRENWLCRKSTPEDHNFQRQILNLDGTAVPFSFLLCVNDAQSIHHISHVLDAQIRTSRQ